MAPLKCCVSDCNSTRETHRLYCFPKNDHLRNLWVSILVPTNSLLIGLSREQLLRKRVCQIHFDKYQFDSEGKRLRYSYPTLFTDNEIAHGVPLEAAGQASISDHNYSKNIEDTDVTESLEIIQVSETGVTNEHNYVKKQSEDDVSNSSLSLGSAGISFHNQPSCSSHFLTKRMETHVPAKVKGIDSRTKLLAPQKPIISVVTNLKQLGSKKRNLTKRVMRIATESLGESSLERLKRAEKELINKELFKDFDLLNKQAQTFMLMQLKQARRKKKARRFTFEEKLMALMLMKQSPKGYKLLECMFALPNKRTLNRLSEKILVEPGLNPPIFTYIANKIKYWDIKQKLCTIVFDEVSLTPHLTFNEKKDVIYGFFDVAGERKLKYCDHALVFMLRGICSSWRQSVAYYFCEGTVSAAGLQKILKQMVTQVAQTGLIPLGLVCDQGSTFRTAMRSFRDETIRTRNSLGVRDDGSINISGLDISTFFDPPHLLKGIRNNFLTKNILWEGKTASWKDIEFIYDLDSKLGHTRALPKLTAHHVEPKKVKKMKVSVAAQVLSSQTAAMLKYTNALNHFHTQNKESTMATTAEVVEFFDTLFDSVNGYPGGSKKGKLRKAIKKTSNHHLFWIDALNKIKRMNFIDHDSKLALQSGKSRLVRVPSLQGWMTTLESFLRLSKLLFEKYNVDYYYPRNINQDPLENFFGRIRAINYRNINPDANTFVYAFKSLVLTNVLSPHSKFSNCEADNGETLLDYSFLFENKNCNKENITENTFQQITSFLPSASQEFHSESLVDQAVIEKVKVQCSAYTAGYIARKISNTVNCKNCLKTYTSRTKEKIHTYISMREYASLKNDNLVYPNELFLLIYRDGSQLIHNYLNAHCYKNAVGSNIEKEIFNNIRLSWLGCEKHKLVVRKAFIKILIRLQVHNWCNVINNILKGNITEKYVSKMGAPQKLALKKYVSLRLRKKKVNK